MIEEFAELLIQLATHFGAETRLVSMHRTRADQERIYASGVRPAAKPGTSTHEYGLAFDLIAVDPSKQELLGLLGEAIGLTWGGRWRKVDPGHFQLVTVADWRAILRSAGV